MPSIQAYHVIGWHREDNNIRTVIFDFFSRQQITYSTFFKALLFAQKELEYNVTVV